MIQKTSLAACVAIAALLAVSVTAPASAAEPASVQLEPATTFCESAAQAVAEDAGVPASATYNFACVSEVVSLSASVNGRNVEATAGLSEVESSVDADGEFTTLAAPKCLLDPERRISSELQNEIDFCVVYGQGGAAPWVRHIVMYWDLYTGWNSAQNKIQSLPSAGTPTVSGTLTSRKQNGIFPPTNIAVVGWSNKGNQTKTGYLGGFTTSGSHSVRIDVMSVYDPQKAFRGDVDTTIDSNRFTCDSSKKRCYFPGGKEAPV